MVKTGQTTWTTSTGTDYHEWANCRVLRHSVCTTTTTATTTITTTTTTN